MAEKISQDNIKEKVSDGVALVDFYAEWCAPCRAQGPIIDELSNQYQGRAGVYKINIDTDRRAALMHGVASIPTLIVFKDGREVQRLVGLNSLADLSEAIEGALN